MRVLVVDDEVGVVHGIRTALSTEGISVDVAHDGHEGYVKATSGGYDVVILDIMLPSMNGYRVCAAMRAQGDWTPVLMLTAKAGEFDEAEGLETGADDYLSKPFSMMVLVARVKALLRRPRTAGVAPYTVGDLHLDPVRHRCWRGTVEIALSAREMDVLAHLVAHAGQTVAKAQLLDNVWGNSFAGDPNIVEVYVRHLRRKVDVAFGCKSIQTVRGVGYRIVASQTPAGH